MRQFTLALQIFGSKPGVRLIPTLDPKAVVETPSTEKDERRFHWDGILGDVCCGSDFFFFEDYFA